MNRTDNQHVSNERQSLWQRIDAKAGEFIETFMGAYVQPIERGNDTEYREPKSPVILVAVPNNTIAFVGQNGNAMQKNSKPSVTPDLDQLVCAD